MAYFHETWQDLERNQLPLYASKNPQVDKPKVNEREWEDLLNHIESIIYLSDLYYSAEKVTR